MVERDCCKVCNVIHDILAGGRAPHVLGLVTAVIHLKLLFMDYSAGNVSPLRTKIYIAPTFDLKEAFGKVEPILTDIWRF